MKVDEIKIVSIEPHNRGQLLKIAVSNQFITILYLQHAIDRIKKWEITQDVVAETLIKPDEVFIGHRNRFIAHKKYDRHLIRAVYEYEGDLPILVTVYVPYADRYYKGGGTYENKIFKGI